MARLRLECPAHVYDSADSEFTPDGNRTQSRDDSHTGKSRTTKPRTSPRKKQPRTYASDGDHSSDSDGQAITGAILVPKVTPKRVQLGRQMQLKPLGAPLLAKPLQSPLRLAIRSEGKLARTKKCPSFVPPVPASQPQEVAAIELPVSDANSSPNEVEIEQSIWCGSDGDSAESDDELPSPRKLIGRRSSPQRRPLPGVAHLPSQSRQPSHGRISVPESDSDVPQRQPLTKACFPVKQYDSSRPTSSSSDKENRGAFLNFSPPRAVLIGTGGPITPPQSPSKPVLESPSKTKTRIPTPPLRESLDAFWNADTVNDWNELHSPRKMLKSPRKMNSYHDAVSQSPASSPRKHSPSKRSKADLALRDHFSKTKHSFATSFLSELDNSITEGQISGLSASTGGVRLIWSKTLNSTAGRANWRKETTKTRHLDGSVTNEAMHFASIELAEKVIDDEHRLLNVLAHEFCHLANFMISGVKDQPHGRHFKAWGSKVTTAFHDRGVAVTTKHSYEIEYKYVWQCDNVECGAEFKRHSKSIDPKRKVCGSCRGKLVQVRPVPRKNNGAGGPVGYAAFVKENFAEVKKVLPAGTSQKAVMEAVGRKYRGDKEKNVVSVNPVAGPRGDLLEQVTEALEVIVLDD